MRVVLAALVLSLPFTGPAGALDVTFSGTVSDTCSLAIATPGLLGLSADGLTLGSEETGGVPAAVTVVSIGVNQITVGAPTRTLAPAAYDTIGEVIEVAYTGTGLLGAISQIYTTLSSVIDVGLVSATTLVVNNRITNPNGFAQGNYETTTVVTCS
jgi:hypothetical protein